MFCITSCPVALGMATPILVDNFGSLEAVGIASCTRHDCSHVMFPLVGGDIVGATTCIPSVSSGEGGLLVDVGSDAKHVLASWFSVACAGSVVAGSLHWSLDAMLKPLEDDMLDTSCQPVLNMCGVFVKEIQRWKLLTVVARNNKGAVVTDSVRALNSVHVGCESVGWALHVIERELFDER